MRFYVRFAVSVNILAFAVLPEIFCPVCGFDQKSFLRFAVSRRYGDVFDGL